MIGHTYTPVPDLKAGMLVRKHGGLFRVEENARPSFGHGPERGFGMGPTDCAVAKATCLEGEILGYFKPGSHWPFQGNRNAMVAVINT